MLARIATLKVRRPEALRGLRCELSAELRRADRQENLKRARGLIEHGSSAGLVAYEPVKCQRAWRAGRLPNDLIQKWARSHYRWWKRAALVSTVPLNVRAEAGAGDAARTLGVCEALVDDRDDMIVKAMSWALRALAVRDGDAVRKFIVRFGARLAPRVMREVGNKLRTGLKNPSRRRFRGPS